MSGTASECDKILVADIDNPSSELSAYDDGNATAYIIAYTATEFTLYQFSDASNTPDPPYVVSGLTGYWIACGGSYTDVIPLTVTDPYAISPDTTTENKVPQWSATQRKLKDGLTVGGASGLAPLDGSTKLDGDYLPALSTLKRGGVAATGTPSGKFLRDDDTWAVPTTDPGSGTLPDGTLTGDFIRWNEDLEVWEVKSEPIYFQGIVLTPISASLVNAEGAIYYDSDDKAVMVCTEGA